MYSLRPLLEADLALVLSWRNRPDVRKSMYTDHKITPEEHQAWFHRVKADPTRHYLVCMDGEVPVGVVNFVTAERHRRGEWGFYTRDLSRRGVGSEMGYLALCFAFETLRLNKLCGEVLSHNEPSLRFHRKQGFQTEGVLRSHHFNGETWLDVHQFAVFRQDWETHLKQELFDRLALNRSKGYGV